MQVDAMNWYLVYTAPRAEKQAADRLKLEGFEAYLPLNKVQRRWSDRIKWVEMPLFPSYIFIKTDREGLFKATRLPGLSRAVYFEGVPVVVRESEIQAVRKFEEHAQGREVTFEIDEEVKIAFGPLEGRVGKVKKVKGNRLVLILSHLGITASINIKDILR